MKETKKVKEKSFSNGTGKGNNLRKGLDDPQNKHTIVDQGCSWTTPLKNCLSAVLQLGLNKASYIK